MHAIEEDRSRCPSRNHDRVICILWILISLGITIGVSLSVFLSHDAEFPYDYDMIQVTIQSNNITTSKCTKQESVSYCSSMLLIFQQTSTCSINRQDALERLLYEQQFIYPLQRNISIAVHRYHADWCVLNLDAAQEWLLRAISLYVVVLFFGCMIGVVLAALVLVMIFLLLFGRMLDARRENRASNPNDQEPSNSYQLMTFASNSMGT